MKYLLGLSTLLSILTFNSCKRCTDCSCSQEISFEFVGYDEAQQAILEDSWTQGFANDYPDENVQVCDTRGKNFKESVQAYRDKSSYKTETYGNNALGYTYEWRRTCTCDYDK